ncbi:hypothetical protein THICB3330014 [Thiomonas sp. CB3]|nr:hypothetical protein THICB3330014 [Thiomonas sp. CB3]
MSDNLKVGLQIDAKTTGAAGVEALREDVRGLDTASAKAAPAQRDQARASDQQGKSAAGSADLVKQLRGALEGLALLKVAQDFVRTAAAQEANRKALEQLTGSAQAGSAEMEYLRGVANRLGVGLDEATRAYVGLSAATKGTALEGQNTKAIFEAVVGSMSKLGKSSAETQNALLAVSQMASKGTISMEDLRGQLGEALPGAMQAAARAMGVTVAELDKMVSSGTVTADELLPKLAAQLNSTFGTEPPDTVNAAIARFENKITQAYTVLGETGSMDAFKNALDGVGVALQKITVVAGGAWAAIEQVGTTIGNIAGAMDQFLYAGESASKAMGDFAVAQAASMDKAANDINKVKDAMDSTQESAQQLGANTAPALAPAKTAAEQLAAAFTATGTAAGGMSTATGAAAQNLAQQFKLNTLQGVLDLADAFVLAGDKATAMSTNVQAAVAKMSAGDLASFAANLKTAFEAGQMDAQRFAEINNTVLAQSFKNLGLDVDQAFGGISQKTGAAINSVDALISSLQAAGQTGPAAAQAIGQALAAATNRADTLSGVEAIRAKIESLRGVLGQTLTDGLLQQATDQAKTLGDAIDKATPGINSLAEAYKALGITSDLALSQTAEKSREAAQVIQQQGGSVREVSAAWQRYLQDALAANNGAVTETMQAEAAAHGLEIAVDASGKAFVRAAGSAQQLGAAAQSAGQQGAQSMQTAADATEQYISAMERAQQQADRLQAIENRRKGVDANGFATSDSGQTIVAGSQVNSKLGIINYLKSGGLSEAEAVQIANKFTGSDGEPVWNHPFYGTGNAAEMAPRIQGLDQTKTPEQNLNDAITKAIENRYGSAGSNNTGAGVRSFGTTSPNADQTAAGRSVTVNLRLPSGSSTGIQVNSNADAQKLIQALKDAGMVGALG